MKSKKKETFEASLNNLEKIVSQLEDGDLSLEESLELFENGVKLSRECQERLNQAERRIEILLQDEDGNPALQSLQNDELENDPKVKRRIRFDEDEEPF